MVFGTARDENVQNVGHGTCRSLDGLCFRLKSLLPPGFRVLVSKSPAHSGMLQVEMSLLVQPFFLAAVRFESCCIVVYRVYTIQYPYIKVYNPSYERMCECLVAVAILSQ